MRNEYDNRNKFFSMINANEFWFRFCGVSLQNEQKTDDDDDDTEITVKF